jgi:UDP-glucose 4-epimerase
MAIYANNEKARNIFLDGNRNYSLEDMMRTAWNWELKLNRDERLLHLKMPH